MATGITGPGSYFGHYVAHLLTKHDADDTPDGSRRSRRSSTKHFFPAIAWRGVVPTAFDFAAAVAGQRGIYFLKASLTFSPASLRLDFA
jgi:hypothetical protein